MMLGTRVPACLIVSLLVAGCGGIASQAPPVPSSPAVVATVPVGSAPTLLAVAPDGQHVYAASNASLSAIDTATNAVVANVPVNPNSTGIAVSPDGSKVYVTSLFSINMSWIGGASVLVAVSSTLMLIEKREVT